MSGKASHSLNTSSQSEASDPTARKVQDQAQKVLSSAQGAAANLAQQATALAQQALQKLPESVTELLPSSIKAGPTATPTHQAAMPVTSETRETTSAPIVDSRPDRPVATHKPLVPEPAGASAGASATETDITKTHTTGNFEAAGGSPSMHCYANNKLCLRRLASSYT